MPVYAALPYRAEVQNYIRSCAHLICAKIVPVSAPFTADERKIVNYYAAEVAKKFDEDAPPSRVAWWHHLASLLTPLTSSALHPAAPMRKTPHVALSWPRPRLSEWSLWLCLCLFSLLDCLLEFPS